jgi:RNA polymerase sigma-70 factor (ECF subfamily)
MTQAHPPNEPSPTVLTERIRAGDRQAEDELVALFSNGLTLMLRRLARDPALAEDLYQETFRIVLEKARSGGIHEPERLAGFLRGTARNLLLAEGRRPRQQPGDATPLAENGPTQAAPQLRRVLRQEEAGLVRKLLGELRFERDRRILADFYLSERTKQEICTSLGVDPEGFKKVLFRARERLRELWERAEKGQRLMENVT